MTQIANATGFYLVTLEDGNGNAVAVPEHSVFDLLRLDKLGPRYRIANAVTQVPYSYDAFYREIWDGASLEAALHAKQAGQVERGLERGVLLLGKKPGKNLWEPTRANAGYALARLLKWGKREPEAVFHCI